MITLWRNGVRVEAGAVPAPDGFCCVTAELFRGQQMVRGYYRHVRALPEAWGEAEREVAEELALMASESE